jgi:hypothetical protein
MILNDDFENDDLKVCETDQLVEHRREELADAMKEA